MGEADRKGVNMAAVLSWTSLFDVGVRGRYACLGKLFENEALS